MSVSLPKRAQGGKSDQGMARRLAKLIVKLVKHLPFQKALFRPSNVEGDQIVGVGVNPSGPLQPVENVSEGRVIHYSRKDVAEFIRNATGKEAG